MSKFKYAFDDNKRYHTWNYYLRNTFGEKIFKVSINAGFTCPNIDGKVAYGGCTYCSKEGSGDFAGNPKDDLIKQFNDHTILISFDDNNYHYYFDGKLYSNDIEVEDAPKIEVGDMFTYYTSDSDPNLYRKEILKSKTSIAYISGEFYVIHEDINSDLEEFHWS